MRPVTLLLSLLLVAALAGSWAYASYRRHLLGPAARNGDTAAVDPATANSDDVVLLQKNLAFFKDQFERLKRENESLSAAVKKLTDQLRSAGAGGAAAGAPAAAFSLDGLVREVEQVRELKFPIPPKFVRIPVTELERKIRDAISRQVQPDEAAARERAARAIGLTEDRFDLLDALTGLTLEQSGGFFDLDTAEMFVDEAADFSGRPDLKGRLVKELAVALLRQQPGWTVPREFDRANDDRALAGRALLIGDAVATKIHYGVVESLNTDYASGQQPITPVAFTGAPSYLREQFLFPYMIGSTFAQELAQDGLAALDAVYARPPQSTAEIQTVDLYRQVPPFAPSVPTWADPAVNGTTPFADNVLGEFGFFLLCKRRLPEGQAFEASLGWAGDRYLCFPGAEGRGDHVIWKTRWRTEKDASEFFQAAQTIWLHRYAIPFNKRYEQSNRDFVVDDPDRVIRLRLSADKVGVTIVDATDSGFADAIEAKFLRP